MLPSPSHPSRFPPAPSLPLFPEPCFHCPESCTVPPSPEVANLFPTYLFCLMVKVLCCVPNMHILYTHTRASQVALVVKNPPVKAGDIKDLGLIYRSKFASTLLRIGWYLLVACKVTHSLCAGGTLHCSQGDVEMPLEEKYVALGSIDILTRLQGQLRCYFFQKQTTWAGQSWFRLCL